MNKTKSENIRILIADDHPIVRQGLSDLLIPRNGMTVVGEAENGRQAVEMAQQLKPDLILMDMIMPELNGAEATALIRDTDPGARILILTSFGNEDILEEALQAGAQGFLLKDSQPDDLLQAVRTVYQGQLILPPHLVLKLIKKPGPKVELEADLTDREREVMFAVEQGMSNKEIAEQLNISINTVRSHISNMLKKLNFTNRTQLAI
ncbi:MAG TPA: DNA-binding response regulator, partial [Chloroflexi bacterium]|nr:DNA-binding response regulator [Chloroflexota bacterium]